MPTLDFMISALGADIHEMQGVIVAKGPGSFTGLRVGLSAAKGLCHGLDIPLIGVSSLEALASQLPFSTLPINPVLDSRKDEVFTAEFIFEAYDRVSRRSEDISVKYDDLPTLFKGSRVFVGNDFSTQASHLERLCGSRALLAPSYCWNLKPSVLGVMGLERFHSQDFDDPQELLPVYLRPPDIRPNPYPLLQDTTV
jgi:tRNA threonylcarbamoyladenosine biosynthesis protein TsaB